MNQSPKRNRLFGLDIGLPLGLLLALGTILIVDFASGGPRKPALEIVFILDEADGLAEFAGQTKKNWLRIVQALGEQGYECRFAVIPSYSDSVQIPSIPLTADTEEFRRKLQETDADSSQEIIAWPETDCLKALNDVLGLEYRDGASIVVFFTTNSIVDDKDRLASIAREYRERGIKTIVQADESMQDFFRPIYKNGSGGEFHTLAGENKTEKSEPVAGKERDKLSLLLPNIAQEAEVQLPTLAGVKVRGRIALVCDISGSMTQDFPPLIKELRSKFPPDTPLILVVGCHFGPPNTSNQRAIKLSESSAGQYVLGVDLSKDSYVYYTENTTDAIILAINEFKRDTVMFNNDLQDGGSRSAIEALEYLRKKRRFTLSGRSLNCDAPKELKDFIKESGGDFKVDTISRSALPAMTWGP